MNRTEAARLCRLVKACCPSQAIDEYTPDIWGEILASYAYADAAHVVRDLVGQPLEPGKSRYIEPGHIIGGIRRMRTQRLTEAPPSDPPSGLSAAEYCAWQRQQRLAVAAGRAPMTRPVAPANPERVAAILRAATPQVEA